MIDYELEVFSFSLAELSVVLLKSSRESISALVGLWTRYTEFRLLFGAWTCYGHGIF